jgi:hypothetical protein
VWRRPRPCESHARESYEPDKYCEPGEPGKSYAPDESYASDNPDESCEPGQ